MRIRVLAATAATLLMAATGCSAGDTSANEAGPGPHALYVTNWKSDTIASFTIDEDGSLRSPASSTKVGSGTVNPQGSVRSHDGRWLYVANWGTADITPYRIEATGVLTALEPVAGPTPKPVTPSAVALSPDGRNLYTANFTNGGDGTVSHYRISPDGRPRGISTIPAQGRGTTGIAISADGHTLLTANMGSGDVSSFTVTSDGSPQYMMTVATGGGAFYPAITPDNRRVLVTNSTEDTISLLNLDRTSRLTVATTIPNPAREPRGIVVSRGGDRAYVANFANGTGPGQITTFTLDLGGIRTLGTPAATGSNGAEGIALSRDGKTLYTANFNTDGDGSITSFAVLPDGTLGQPRPPVLTGGKQPDLGSITVPVP